VRVSVTSSGLVSINNHLWSTWMKTAIEQAQRARQARGRLASYPWSPEQSPSAEWIALLEQEFQASLVAITASALALDALYGAAISEQLRGSRSKRAGRAGKIHELLKDAFDTGPVNKYWADEFKWLFAQRDAGVHPEEKPQPSDRHPLGMNLSPEYVQYSVERQSAPSPSRCRCCGVVWTFPGPGTKRRQHGHSGRVPRSRSLSRCTRRRFSETPTRGHSNSRPSGPQSESPACTIPAA
jgi:hypothetical protein